MSVLLATAFSPRATGRAAELAFVGLTGDTRQIFLIRADGSGLRALTRPPGHNEGPVWTPDGGRLAYVHADARGMQIYTMRADGSGKRRLTGPPGVNRAPTWSPDGRWIAYVNDRGGTSQIFIARDDGRRPRALTEPPRSNEAPVWSPEGNRIAYLSKRAGQQKLLYVMRPDGRDQRIVPTRATGIIPVVNSVQWLPDSGLVYTSRAGLAAEEIAFVRPDGSGYRWFSSGYAPSVSPDGAQVAYVVSRVGSAQVYLKLVAGGASRPLTPRSWISIRPAWSPDGGWIAYLSVKPGEQLEVWEMRADGTGRRRLAPAAGNLEILPVISWRP